MIYIIVILFPFLCLIFYSLRLLYNWLLSNPVSIQAIFVLPSQMATNTAERTAALFRVSDASGKLEFKEIAKGGEVKRNLLSSDDVFILDTGSYVFVWTGRKASVAEKRKALSYAQDYMSHANILPNTPVVGVKEGGDNDAFESFFH